MSHCPPLESESWLSTCIGYHLMAQQAVTGIAFDVSAGDKLIASIAKMMAEIEADVEPFLPDRPLNKGEIADWRMPAKPFTKDGGLSAAMHRWIEKTGAKLYTQRDVKIGEEVYPVVGGAEIITRGKMRLSNQSDIKKWLITEGWEPTLFNFKKDARGKPVRDDKGKLIPTSAKMQDQGRLCPNLEVLQGPIARQVVMWLSLRNRKSVVEGWLGDERIPFDGRLSAGASGYASSFRYRHTCVVNVPKDDPTVTLGKEMRQLFVARDGYRFVGYDATALEARVEAHYCRAYAGGEEYARDLLEGDVHLKTALSLFGDKIGHLHKTERWNKDDSDVKVWRSKAKNVRYAIGYGAQPPKIASMLGVKTKEAEEILNAFWENAKPLAELKKRLTIFWETNGKSWIPGIDGRRVPTRSKHSLVNTLFQSCGAIVMETSNIFMDKWLGGLVVDKDGYPCYSHKEVSIYRTGYFHDELTYEAPQSIAEEIVTLGCNAIAMAGKHHKLRVALTGEGKIGLNWSEVH